MVSAPNPKLQAKISADTPDSFVDAVCDTIRRGNSSISIINDDNACAAMLKLGCTLEEARTTLMSGCWDFTIKNKEVKTIPIRASLPKILEYTMTDGICLKTGMRVLPAEGRVPETYEEFEEAFREAMAGKDFYLIDCMIDSDEKVWPMVAPGGSISEAFAEEDLDS
jgi:pyruvate-formate lyase